MKTDRVNRLNSLIHEQLGQILLHEMQFAPGVIVSIIDVDTAPDLSQSKIHTSIYAETPAAREYTFIQLRQSVKHLRYLLANTIEVRKIPKLYFELDESIAASERIYSLLNSVKQPS